MSQLLQTLSEMQYDQLVPVGLLFVCGLLLWAAGRRVMRAGFAATGFLIGGIVGWTFGETADLGVAPWIAGISGAFVVAVVATLAYRFAVAAAVGLLMAALTPMGIWTAQEHELLAFASPTPGTVEQPPLAAPAPGPGAVDPASPGPGVDPGGGTGVTPAAPLSPELEGWLEGILQGTGPGQGGATGPAQGQGGEEDAGGESGEVGMALRKPFTVMGELFRTAWEGSAPTLRGTFVAAAAFGAMLGFVLGAMTPGFSATLVSALGGSFLLLTTGCVLATQLGFSGEAALTRSPTFWTALWVVLSLLGLGIQSIFQARSADKAAS